jgi:copper chaperone
MDTLTVNVPGMSCAHCEATVRSEVGSLPGVTHVDVDLATKDVVVHGSAIDPEAVAAAIDAAGYDVA